MRASILTKIVCVWISLVAICIVLSIRNMCTHNKFFTIGPSDDLMILGISINTVPKYILVCIYTIISTIMRTLQQEVIYPWIIHNVQNNEECQDDVKKDAYFIVIVDVIYHWIDWFMYMNILLTQSDFMVLEIIGNIATSVYTTRVYLQPKLKEKYPYISI